MLNLHGISFSIVCLFTGAVLLYAGVSESDAAQTARVIGGAAFFSLGLVVMSLVVKDWWERRRREKRAKGSRSQWTLRKPRFALERQAVRAHRLAKMQTAAKSPELNRHLQTR